MFIFPLGRLPKEGRNPFAHCKWKSHDRQQARFTIPATKDQPERFVETIEVQAYRSFGEEVLTPESMESCSVAL